MENEAEKTTNAKTPYKRIAKALVNESNTSPGDRTDWEGPVYEDEKPQVTEESRNHQR